jgi:hypothetical protein
MNRPIPEVTVLIDRIRTDRVNRVYALHVKEVLDFKHWDKKRGVPKR